MQIKLKYVNCILKVHVFVLYLNLKSKYTGFCVDNDSISALGAETSKTMQQCYYFAGRHKGTIIRTKQALNSTGSAVGIAWVTVCWGVLVCSQGWPCRWS